MNRFTKDIKSGKRMLLPLAAYYLVLLLIAVSWTQKELVEPNIVLRLLFTLLFILPLFRFRNLAPAVIAIFATIRMFSVAPYGYLPSDIMFYFCLTLLLFFIDIIQKNYRDRRTFSFDRPSKRLIVLLTIVLLSNSLNLITEYAFLILLVTSMMLSRFVRSSDEFQMMEIAFMVVTFCLSVYAFIFRNDFAVKDFVSKGVIERSYWTDPNYLGGVLTIGIVISFYYFMNKVEDKVVYRMSYLVIFIAGFITLGMLASRGAFLAAIVPMLYILYKKTNSIKNLVFVVVFVGITITALSSTDYFAGLEARMNIDDPTGSHRTEIWEESFNRFIDSDMLMLLVGGGTNYSNLLCQKAMRGKNTSPHNNYLVVLYDYGILGLIIFLSILYSWFTKNFHNVLAVSLALQFSVLSLTLVPLGFLPFWFLVIFMENQSRRHSIQRGNSVLYGSRSNVSHNV
jgi:hypothetical protein